MSVMRILWLRSSEAQQVKCLARVAQAGVDEPLLVYLAS